MSSANLSQRFALASHVRACACDLTVVLLDLRSNRYLGIGEPASRLLGRSVDGWPCSDAPSAVQSAAHCDTSTAGDMLRQLCAQGLLVAAPPIWKSRVALERSSFSNTGFACDEAVSTVDLDRGPVASMKVTRDVWQALRFTRSVATASFWLRCRSLYAIASTVAAGRSRHTGPQVESIEAMTPSLMAYERLRPLLFTARSQCLLDSLSLISFLAAHGLLPRWVVGVKTGPFGAHSWVQCGGTVLNDHHEYVRQFRPILVV